MTIENGKYYELGRRVYWLFILQRSAPPLILLILSLFLYAVKGMLSGLFNPDIYGGIYSVQSAPLGQIGPLLNIIVGIIAIIAVIAEIIGVVIAQLQYKASKIMLDDYSLKITRGIISREESELPYRRIESVELKQSAIDRMLNIGRLIIEMTGNIESDSVDKTRVGDETIPIMSYELARAVADVITDRAQIERMQVQKDNMIQNK